MTPETQSDSGRGIRDQIERYRTAFSAVVAMIVIAALVAGYILANERLSLPSWVPVLGHSHYTLRAEFQTAQAVTPGQGQAVTLAGAKIGEVASVSLVDGRAVVTMNITPKYATYIHRDATMLLRPKTQLKDMTVEVDPGTLGSPRLHSGTTIPLSQTAPDVNVDEFLSSLDLDTRAYLQELLAGAAEGLDGNGRNLGATFKRFDPIARNLQLIGREVAKRHANIARSIHNFRIFMEALGTKDAHLAEMIDSSNAVFATFAKEDRAVQETLRELPGALHDTGQGLGKLATAAHVLGPTLHQLEPFARAFGPAQQQTRPFFKATTPILKDEIGPFAHEVQPVVNKVQPSLQNLNESFPQLTTSFSVLNELLNELAYNPSQSQAGFVFFLDWANHNFNSALSQTDAHGAIGHTLLYFNCNVVPILTGAEAVNPTVALLLGLLNPPSEALCNSARAAGAAPKASAASTQALTAGQLADRVFGQGPDAFVAPPTAIGGGN